MKKTFKNQINKSLLIMFIFLFLIFNVYTKSFAIDTSWGPTLEETQIVWNYSWYLSYYGGSISNGKISGLGAHPTNTDRVFEYSDFLTRNDKYGWYEYDYNGTKCAVLAGATVELNNENPSKFPIKNGIHYFKLGRKNNKWSYDIIQFKFDPTWSDDDTVFTGIILDSCGVSMNPPAYGKKAQTQWLDAYLFPLENKSDYDVINASGDYDDQTKQELMNFKNGEYDKIKNTAEKTFNQKKIIVSDNGVFSEATSGDTLGIFFINFFADIISKLADTIQIVLDAAGTEKDIDLSTELTLSRTTIEGDDLLQKSIEISDAVETPSGGNNTNRAYISLPNYVLNQAGFEEMRFVSDTKIPVIPIDLYTMTRNHINLVDDNFFDLNNNNPNKFWNFIRNQVVSLAKVLLYISAGLVLTTLIWRSILLVMSSVSQDPEKAAIAKRKINSILKNVIFIVIVYFIMALILYLYKTISNIIMIDSDSYYTYRLTIPGLVTFNTNVIGFVKMLTLTTNGFSRLLHSILYLIMALINLIWFCALVIRMLAIGLLIILSPLTSIMTVSTEASGQERGAMSFMNFYNWISMYTLVVFMPLMLMIIERIMILILS